MTDLVPAEPNPHAAEALSRQMDLFDLIVCGPDGAMADKPMEQLKAVADHLGMSTQEYVEYLAWLGTTDMAGAVIRQEIRTDRNLKRMREMVTELVDFAVKTRFTDMGDGEGGCLLADVQQELRKRFPKTPQPEKKSKRKPIPPGTRTLVLERDEYRCVYCGDHRNLQVDHDLPVSRGGTNEVDNLQTLCRTHNASKGTNTMEEWLAIVGEHEVPA